MNNSGNKNRNDDNSMLTSIAPWLSIPHNVGVVDFYKSAFGAIESYHLDVPDGGIVSKLSVDGAEFWLSLAAPDDSKSTAASPKEDPVRMILTVANPEAFFARALAAGATEVYPVGEQHGWKLGRLVDPFGFHWEIGYQLTS